MKIKASIFYFIFSFVSIYGLHAQPIPFNKIVGFDVTDVDGDGIYVFCPLCKDDPDDPSSHPCTSYELRPYLFEWKFGEGDYSVLSTPSRAFAGTGELADVAVTLRVKGIKEEDYRVCISGEGDCIYRLAMPPDDWQVVYESTRTFTLNTSETAAIVGPEYTYFNGLTRIAARIGRPYCSPIWDGRIVYPVIFHNPTTCGYNVEARVYHETQTTAGVLVRGLIGCEDFVPSTAVACTTTGERGEAAVDMAFFILGGSSRVVLIEATMPESGEGFNPEQHLLTLKATWTIANHDQGCTSDSTMERTHGDTIVSTIDPNTKWVTAEKKVYREGERVPFAVQFKNIGTKGERLVYFEDPLDRRLNGAEAKFDSLKLFNADGSLLAETKALRFSPMVTSDGRTVLRLTLGELRPTTAREFHHTFEIGEQDSGIIWFSVPVGNLSSTSSNLPQWLTTTVMVQDTVQNIGYTMFSEEGLGYQSSPATFLVEWESVQPSLLFWILVILLFLLVVFIIVWVVIAIRRWVLQLSRAPVTAPQYGGANN